MNFTISCSEFAVILLEILAKCLSMRYYLNIRHGITKFDYFQCDTFSSQEDRNLQILSTGHKYIKSRVFFENHHAGAYAGLVFRPLNSYFVPYIQKHEA